jgi:uncharacterized LabA/DUF88 family protein
MAVYYTHHWPWARIDHRESGETMARAAVFIDGAYFDNVKRQLFGAHPPKVDLHRLSDEAASPYERLRTYYYHCLPHQIDREGQANDPRYSAMQGFLKRLRQLPRFQVRLGTLARRGEVFEQKRVDILIAVDLVRMSWDHHIGTACLLTGDSDFVPAVEAAKDAGVLVKLFYLPGSFHAELHDACDERIAIDRQWLGRFINP